MLMPATFPVDLPAATPDPARATRLRVVLLSVPPRSTAVLEFFFANSGRGSFVMAPEDQADVAIFDLDTLASREHWERFVAERAKPGIALAVQPHDLPDTVWVQKPVTPAALLAAAVRARGMTVGAAVDLPAPALQAPAQEVPPAVSSAPLSEAQPILSRTSQLGAQDSVWTEDLRAGDVLPIVAVDDAVAVELQTDRITPVPMAAEATQPPRHDPPIPQRGGVAGWVRRWFGSLAAAKIEPAPCDAVPACAAGVVVDELEPRGEAVAVAGLAPTATKASLSDAPDGFATGEVEEVEEADLTVTEPAVPEPVAPVAVVAEPAVPAPAAFAPSQTAPEHRPSALADEALWCGLRADVDLATLQSADWRYRPADRLVSVLGEAYRVSAKWRVPTLLDTTAGPVLVDAPANRVYAPFDEARWAALYAEVLARRPKARTINQHELAELQAGWLGQACVRRLDALLWEAGALTAAGRLPEALDAGQPVYLRHWPNLTRLRQTPHTLRIAALWATRGAGLLETAELLRIPQRHVFAFHAAAAALDLITDDGSHIRRVQRRAARNKGLLSRLLGWLQQ